MKKLEVGCGKRKSPDFIGIDIVSTSKADILAKSENMPFKDDIFEYASMKSVIEHVDAYETMKEMHRVCKNEAIVEIWTPHWTSEHVWAHLQHKRGFSWNTFRDDKNEEYGFPFKVLCRKIFSLGREKENDNINVKWYVKAWLNVIEKIANRFPNAYERLLWQWIGASESIYFRLKILK